MSIEVSAFRWVPPIAQGYVKDLRVRWALEEAGLPYEAVLIDRQVQHSGSYRSWQPFGQVPAYRDDTVEMFESGAIVLHIASKSEALSPRDDLGKTRVMSWVIAALNSVEPYAQSYLQLGGARPSEPGLQVRRIEVEERLNDRLGAVSRWLGEKDYLEQRFTAGDLIMTTVLRELVNSGILTGFPNLEAYRRRCEARPAFARAMAAQMTAFREHAPAE